MNRQLFNILLANQPVDKNLLKLDSREIVNFGSSANTSKRSFTGKGIIKGFAYSNYYNPYNVTNFEKYKNGFRFTNIANQAAYGIGFDIKTVPSASYAVSFDGLMTATMARVFMTEFDAEGNMLRFKTGGTRNDELNARVFTTGENTTWIVISFQNELGTTEGEYNNVSITLME